MILLLTWKINLLLLGMLLRSFVDFNIYFVGSTCHVQLKQENYGFKGCVIG